ncbi:hypothetical protein DOQ87_24480 [Salmonella enterica subsp. enterica serovar Benin]|nr:hypothetical protein [Salmonella enterica subsp. enterica serovar Benin]EBW4219307.1 hypothetical protein [Salmonella enterica subsp. enterica serovar Benin]
MLFSWQRDAPWQQFTDPVYRLGGDDVKYMVKVALWIYAVQFSRTDQAVQQCSALTTVVRSEEQKDGMNFI